MIPYNRSQPPCLLQQLVHLPRRSDLVGRCESDEHEGDDDGEEGTCVNVVGKEGGSESSDPDVDDYSDGDWRGRQLSSVLNAVGGLVDR